MNNYTSLNIVNGDHKFKYIVEFENYSGTYKICTPKYYTTDKGVYFWSSDEVNVSKNKNYWEEYTGTTKEEYIPTSDDKKSKVTIYFPRYSVDTYENNVLYALSINTWINGKCVYFCSYLLNRSNAIACEKGPKKFLDDIYYECISFDIINPNSFIYSDLWKDFRHNVCGEPIIESTYQYNNTGSNMNITLTPVKYIDNEYIKLENYDSSQSALSLIDKEDLSAHIDFINNAGTAKIKCLIKFNSDYTYLSEYIKETYFVNPSELKITYCLYIKTKTDAYKYVEHALTSLEKENDFLLSEFEFDSWEDYVDGMNINVVAIIKRNNEDFLVFSSNEIPVTKDLFRFLIKNNEIKYVKLEDISMNTYNLDVVNRTENIIYTTERKENSRSNIIENVFVKVQNTDTIQLHKNVNENIVINLDAYKNKVDIFTIKIGDYVFNEIGRISSGIVFKIIGSKINEISDSGVYYIMNDEQLVTTGNYKVDE